MAACVTVSYLLSVEQFDYRIIAPFITPSDLLGGEF